jgi:methionyl-tRNA synthetase
LKIIPEYVTPESRKNEVLARVKEGLNDICISRKGAKWGIDFPDDKNYKIWVWVDALINYISGLKNKEKKFWPANVHVIGKGINWFHSVIWPALLLSAGFKLPEKLLVHGYLTQSKQKISKSLGNVVDPLNLLEKYPSDVVRYSLLKCSVFEDSEYDEDVLITRNNNELADKLGNLISRVSTLAEKYGLSKTPQASVLDSKALVKSVESHLEKFELDKALNEIFALIDKCNEYIQSKKPWEPACKDKGKILYQLASAIKDFTILLSPFLPETSEKIAKTFSFKISLKEIGRPLTIKPITKSDILFKKVEIKENKPKGKVTSQETIGVIDVVNNLKPKRCIKEIEASKKLGSLGEGIANMADMIKYNDFAKLDLRVATIKKVEDIEGADKLYKLEVEIGNEKRTIVAGIKEHYKKEELKAKQVVVVCNLESRKMKGIESQGMLLAAVSDDHSKVILISPEKKVDSGYKVS